MLNITSDHRKFNSVICFVQGDKGGSSAYRFYCPPNAAGDAREFGSNKEEFMVMAKKSCREVLRASVHAWMGNPPGLIAVEVNDPDRYLGRVTFVRKRDSRRNNLIYQAGLLREELHRNRPCKDRKMGI